MDLELFNELMKQRPSQYRPEWRMFLEICEIYLKKHKIENPIAVELGTGRNRQKKFYEQLLGVHHIGIDIFSNQDTSDILGDTHDPKTIKILKKKLGGRPVNILFIDASHYYEDVKKDFELYQPLCSDIIAFHDIEAARGKKTDSLMVRWAEVWKFWDELKAKAHMGKGEYKDFLFLSISQYRGEGKKGQYGIGMILKK